MRFAKACVEALAILAAVVAIVGGILGFVIFTAAASQAVGVWLFPVTIIGAYLIFVAALWQFHKPKGGKRRAKESSSASAGDRSPGNTGSVVKLDDETVATAILEAKRRHHNFNTTD